MSGQGGCSLQSVFDSAKGSPQTLHEGCCGDSCQELADGGGQAVESTFLLSCSHSLNSGDSSTCMAVFSSDLSKGTVLSREVPAQLNRFLPNTSLAAALLI